MNRKKTKRRSAKLGLPPGTFMHIGEKRAELVEIDFIKYSQQTFTRNHLNSIDEDISSFDLSGVNWVNITGLQDTELIQQIGKNFKIHALVLEDILNTEHRSKVEVFDDYIFLVLKMITYDTSEKALKTEQISFILTKDTVISFQEHSGDVLDPVRQRISAGKGRIRSSGPDYLLYALMDIIIDHYYLVLENINEEIEDLENIVIYKPDPNHLQKIHFLKRELIDFRKSAWPVREIVSELLREESHLISRSSIPFIRDIADHILNVTETIDSTREMVTGLLDIYLSNLSNRMNEVMKVLTIIATIFIPLSFLAGVYGMNFEVLPELQWRFGYPMFWGISLALLLAMIGWFRHRKWL